VIESRIVMSLAAALSCALTAAAAGTAEACRGMAHRALPWMGAQGPVLTVSGEAEHVSFDLEGVTGRYTALYPRADLFGSRWSVGALFPVIDLRTDGFDDELGFGNPRIYGQATVARSAGLSVGLEVDLPWGMDEVSGDHAELIPFLSVEQSGMQWGVFASLGFRAGLGSDHAHGPSHHESAGLRRDPGHDPDVDPGHDPAGHDPGHDDESGDAHHLHGSIDPVDPHSDRELLYRVGVTRNVRDTSIQVYLDGQSVVKDVPGPKQFAAVGLEVEFPGLGLLWAPGVELPLGEDRRFESAIHLGVRALF